MTKKQSVLYSPEFFNGQVDRSASSAAVVVPLVLSILPAKGVVDVGCGVAPWAAAFLANGVPDVWGIDGDYVDRSQLRIPPDRFLERDLAKPLRLNRNFDLAVCLEVAEHLPASRAAGFVADLTSMAPCVLFSAAVPGQIGTGHINEQYLSYWAELFQKAGYEGRDPIRPSILGNNSVECWYQQNMVMFAAPEHSLLSKGFPKAQGFIHQEIYERTRRRPPTLRKIARSFPGAVGDAIRYHLGLPVRNQNG